MNGDKVIRIIATLTLWLAPLPAAFFVGRSVYYHLIHNWRLELGALGIAAAVIAGAMVELVGILSAHVALATGRWNRKGQVRKEKSAWERAPFGWAAGCFVAYVIAAVLLTVVLEAEPEAAVLAPALFTFMAAAAYVSVGIYEQHRDRLDYYGLGWNWKTTQGPNDDAEQVEPLPNDTEPLPEQGKPFTCPICNKSFDSQAALSGHGNKHRNDKSLLDKDSKI